MPFYSGPLSRNLLKYGGLSSPRFGGIKAIHLLQHQGLPFDNLINDATVKYCEQNSLPTMKAWHCYSYRQTDVESLQTYLCIQNRSTLAKPELRSMSSSKFTFESYLKQYDTDKLELLK